MKSIGLSTDMSDQKSNTLNQVKRSSSSTDEDISIRIEVEKVTNLTNIRDNETNENIDSNPVDIMNLKYNK
jgi:K+-transporting ATPase c subunit